MRQFDLIVLGAGPGGYTAALTAARYRLKTLLVEKKVPGGTCLNRGCIPTKALLTCAERYAEAAHGTNFGVPAVTEPFGYTAAAAHRDQTVKRLRSGLEFLIRKSGCEYAAGEAALVDSGTIELSGESIGFENLILATGSVPAPPPFPIDAGAAWCDSDGFLALSEIPPKVTLIGAGVIGLEFASILVKTGHTVTVIEAAGRILPPMDAELAKFIRRILEKEGVTFHVAARVRRVAVEAGQTFCEVEGDGTTRKIASDLVVCAVGRMADTSALHVERPGLAMRRSFIRVDDRCMTSVAHLYAVGDVNGCSMLAHAAMDQGERVATNLALHTQRSVLGRPVPACVYTDPELASVGLTEDEAQEAGYTVKTGRCDAPANGRSLTAGERDGFVKIVADAATGKILGAQMATSRATDLIGEIAVALNRGLTVAELAETIHPHPTFSEMIADACRALKAGSV